MDSDDLMRLARRLQLATRERVQPLRWRPAADIYRTREGWLVKIELAGVRSEEIELKVSGRWLTVRGRRYDMALVEGCEHYSLEIAYSHFERSIELPCALEQARAVTQYRDGMLLVRIITEGSQT
ncbi:Hsp20/alpha crystallin family protein [Thermithiobacillus tepidarius DSM 3134]|uniref:Hsp20/alpha crystallin family protein n=1 Tax=Thermithiobacillus tepidarius TaxID=929 RepID=UPI00041B81E1|nr:Hsp20/alpha crystallin family protein [Thermithiobacillus tepidarius]